MNLDLIVVFYIFALNFSEIDNFFFSSSSSTRNSRFSRICLQSKVVRSPLPPARISTPQPPYGCSQVNRLTKREALSCFAEAQVMRRRDHVSRTSLDVGVTVPELIRNHGYPVEIHHVTSEDGYITGLIRIPHGKLKNANEATKGPVFLQHGVLGSAAQWVVNAPEDTSLGFLLADSGYDVWLGNLRGTRYSEKHVKFNARTDFEYWDFSWHEMGKYDMHISIDYILANYTDKRLFFIAHSMGASALFVALSHYPEYNAKIKAAYLMAPAVFLGNATNLAHLIALPAYHSQPFFFGLLNGTLVSPSFSETLANRLYPFCDSNAAVCSMCTNILFGYFGFDYPQVNFDQLEALLYHFPDACSTKTLLHFAQSMVTGEFREFDYGPRGNPLRYNQSCTPPAYNLANIKTKIVLFWSWNDNFAAPNDVKKLKLALTPYTDVTDVEVEHCAFNHIDFPFAKDAHKFVYSKIVKSMNNFESAER